MDRPDWCAHAIQDGVAQSVVMRLINVTALVFNSIFLYKYVLYIEFNVHLIISNQDKLNWLPIYILCEKSFLSQQSNLWPVFILNYKLYRRILRWIQAIRIIQSITHNLLLSVYSQTLSRSFSVVHQHTCTVEQFGADSSLNTPNFWSIARPTHASSRNI